MPTAVAADPLKNAIMAYVQRVIEHEISLTPLPWVARRLIDLLANEVNPDPRKIARIIKNDVVLSARTLSAVNQEAEKYGSRICSVDSAVAHLGVQWFCAFARELEDAAALESTHSDLMALHRLVWRHSLMRAELAHSLAESYEQWEDQAYTCALLSQLGTITALRCLEQILSAHSSSPFSPNRCLELAHSYNEDILAKLREPLKLPDAVAMRGAETTSNSEVRSMRRLLAAASTLAGTIDCDPCFSLDSLDEILVQQSPTLRETVVGMALGISANVQYQDDQGPVNSLGTLSTALPRSSGTNTTPRPIDFRVTLDDPSREYRSLHTSGLEISLQGECTADVGSVTRIEIYRGKERFQFSMLVQGCIEIDEGGYLLDLVHLSVHEEGLARWRSLLGEDAAGARIPSEASSPEASRNRREDCDSGRAQAGGDLGITARSGSREISQVDLPYRAQFEPRDLGTPSIPL